MSVAEVGSRAVPASFRDPAGRVYLHRGRVFRTVASSDVAFTREFLASALCADLIASRQLVHTSILDRNSIPFETFAPLVLEHEAVWFPSYPAEWPAGMLYAAAELTLNLLERALTLGLGIKDATPYNVMFRGAQSQFIDLLSFERRDPADPQWLAFAQFSRTFLLPLLANREYGLRLSSTFLQFRDGLEPDQVYALLSPLQRLKPSMLHLVCLPKWLSRVAESKGDKIYVAQRVSPERARFTLERVVRSARSLLKSVPPRQANSTWTGYTEMEHAAAAVATKSAFVANAIQQDHCNAVLDVGCNTGEYSRVAAKTGARVVAIDFDPGVVGENWQRAREQQLDILPLVVDIARPTPALGWRNREQASFLDRATGKFDCVLMLGLIHHLLVSERVPLSEVIELAAQLTTRTLILEFVPASDPMFRHIARGRDALHADFTRETFEQAVMNAFDIVSTAPVSGGERILYWLRKKH